MSPRQYKYKPRGDRPAMDQITKKANHSASENNRLKNIASGITNMLALLSPEVQNIPGIEKKQAVILQEFAAEIDRELQRGRDLQAEKLMLELHSQNGTIPTTSGDVSNFGLPSPPDSQKRPVYNPASGNIPDFSSHDISENPSNEPNLPNVSNSGAHQVYNNLGDEPFNPHVSSNNFANSCYNHSNEPSDSNLSNHDLANTHNNPGNQTNNTDFSNLELGDLDLF